MASTPGLPGLTPIHDPGSGPVCITPTRTPPPACLLFQTPQALLCFLTLVQSLPSSLQCFPHLFLPKSQPHPPYSRQGSFKSCFLTPFFPQTTRTGTVAVLEGVTPSFWLSGNTALSFYLSKQTWGSGMGPGPPRTNIQIRSKGNNTAK